MHELYKDENLRIVKNEGDSDFVVIAFSPMNYQAKNDDDFYIKNIARNHNFNLISVMALKNHWYPISLFCEAQKIINQYINSKRFSHVITYGVSMGAYASIKYSKSFGASRIIAMMPQWSINPAESLDTRYSKEFLLFKDKLIDMSIRQVDIQGILYLFYDSYFYEDAYQARRIIDISKDVVVIKTNFVGHTLGHILIGSDFFIKFLRLILSNNVHSLNLLVKDKMKSHPMYYQGVIRYALKNHSQSLVGILKKIPDNHNLFSNKLFHEEAKSTLRKMKIEDALFYIKKFTYIENDNILQLFAYKQNLDKAIYTAHENFLCYDFLDKKLLLVDLDKICRDCFIIPLKFYFDFGILGFFTQKDNFIPIIRALDGSISLGDKKIEFSPNNYNIQPFFLYRKISDFYVISDGSYHATATPKNTVDFGKSHIKNWEIFKMQKI